MSSPTFGLVLPSSTGSDVPSPEAIWEIAERADASSLDYLWVSDHLIWWHPMYESLTLLGALATRTKRIGIGPGVLQLAMREPMVVAKELATIARLSNGRLTVGVGVGGEFPPEWASVGVDRSTRGQRTDEMLEALSGMWAGEPFTMTGKHVRLESVQLQPSVPHRPPIWIGGRKTAALRRAARLGDGFMGLFVTPEMYADNLKELERLCAEQGRDSSALDRSLYVWTCIADTRSEARDIAERMLGSFYNVPFERLERYAIVGSEDDCIARFKEFADAGVTNFAVSSISRTVSVDPLNRLISLVDRGL